MATFRCRACGAALTPSLREVPMPPAPHDADAWIERGTCARDPEPFGPPYVPEAAGSRVHVSAGPQGTRVVHLDDALVVRHVPMPDRRMSGCCGPSGIDGWNRLCSCGAEIGAEQSDCWTPHVLRLSPEAVVSSSDAV